MNELMNKRNILLSYRLPLRGRELVVEWPVGDDDEEEEEEEEEDVFSILKGEECFGFSSSMIIKGCNGI